MNTLEAIYSRRSIRKFSKEKIMPQVLEELLKAAMSAPSARNEQPWQFLVIDETKILEEIVKIHPHASMAPSASLGILIAGDLRLQKVSGYWSLDCAAATQNLLLAAHEKGLGAVWTGVFPDKGRVEAFQKLFSLPKEVLPFAFVPIGYPKESPKAEGRFLKERIHQNKW
jgi:nitroreductase